MIAPVTDREALVRLIAARSVKRGRFTLASGRESDFYVDCRLTTMSPDGLVLVGPLSLAALRATGWGADSVGGLTLGADPVSYAIAYASQLAGEPLRCFTVRKAPKTHGSGRRIEGSFRAGDRVVVIEDTITTGGSALDAVDAVAREGGHVVGVYTLVDREEGGREAITARGIPVLAFTTARELLTHVP
ncbi:MAG: orotate phosphoribosyltransferase [Gemmatimonadaceae bacterium]|nr:orotate phosphoribosyltransferase [Gemmatimonadaceae bacterium]